MPPNTNCVHGAQHPMENSGRHDTHEKVSFAFEMLKPDSQHVTLGEMNCLKSEAVSIVPDVK